MSRHFFSTSLYLKNKVKYIHLAMNFRKSIKKYVTGLVVIFSIFTIVFGDPHIIEAATPTVVTMPAINISKTSAVLAGVISDDGGSPITATGFEYGTTVGYGQSAIGEGTYRQISEFGTIGTANGEMDGPTGIDLDSNGDIYVVDTQNDRVEKFNGSTHAWLQNIGTPGTADNEMEEPLDITVLSDDSLWVADRVNGPTNTGGLMKYDSSGVYVECINLNTCATHFDLGSTGFATSFAGLTSDSSDNIFYSKGHEIFGIDATTYATIFLEGAAAGSADGFFDDPKGLFIDGSNNLYIADRDNNRIQKLDSSGNFLMKFGTSGTGDGEFNGPTDVSVDIDGNIFVADSGNSRIQKFDSLGNFILEFGILGSQDDELTYPTSLVIDTNQDLYITDTGNNRVVKYQKGFTSDLSVVLPTLTCGTIYHYRAFATNADGASFGADEQFTTLDCEIPIAKTTSYSGVTASSALLAGSHEDQGSMYTTERGFEYGTSTSYGSEVSEDGDLFIDTFGGSGGGGGGGTFLVLNSVGTDKDGNFFTTDSFEDVIQKFDSSGNHVSDYTVSAPAPGGVTNPVAVRGAPDGKLYAVDSVNSKIIRFDDSNFTNPTTFGGGLGLSGPNDIAFDSTGNIYIVDRGNQRVIKTDSTGASASLVIDQIGGGAFTDVTAVAVDSTGNIYVADSGISKIIVYDSAGVEQNQAGSNGTNDGQFGSSIPSMAVDEYGFLLVDDANNNRIQKFDNLIFQSKFGKSGTSNGEFSTATGMALGQNGDIFVADSGNNRVQKFNERFTLTASGLACGTTYHYRAYATSPDGTGTGTDDTFTTDACPPSGGGGGGGGSGTHFICTDPTALNYTPETETGKPKNSTCKYPEKDLSCKVPLYLTKAVRYGDANNPDDVRLLENFLNAYEYKNLPVDGFYSATDRDAVIKWQEKYPVEILKPWGLKHGTGYVYLTSLKKIKEIHEAECARLGQSALGDHCYLYDRKLKRGDNNVFVKSAQKALQASGSLSGIADGVFGRKTEQAVKDFQILKGLKSDGIIGVGTGHELGQVNCRL